MRALLVFAAAWLLALTPGIAAACPQCASRDGPGLSITLMLGAMILLPFAVFFIVLRIIRRGDPNRHAPGSEPG